MLEAPTDTERDILGNFKTSRNEVCLHTDSSLLPVREQARAAWNYNLRHSGGRGDQRAATVTYYMNRLQSLDAKTDYCVTLNAPVPDEAVIARFRYSHPLYTQTTTGAQAALRALSGERRTHYAGAHLGNGFHEAGLASGVEAAAALGVEW